MKNNALKVWQGTIMQDVEIAEKDIMAPSKKLRHKTTMLRKTKHLVEQRSIIGEMAQ